MEKLEDTALWKETLEGLRSTLTGENIETWLEPLRLKKDGNEGTFILTVPNRFYCDWISTHYLDLVTAELQRLCESEAPPKVTWEVEETSPQTISQSVARNVQTAAHKAAGPGIRGVRHARPPQNSQRSNLNPKYCFDTFVVGPSNQLAYAACYAACTDPGVRYNPLFMYGGVGLGKTHLLNAVGHEIVARRNFEPTVHYVSAELFTNEFIAALRKNDIESFRKRYRYTCDILLVDDIQFLAGREQTQEEFFHTFNALYHRDCQIVLTSDMVPQQLEGMQERLVSRFRSGLVVDLQPPGVETRVAILQKKAATEGLDLPHDVAFYLAERVVKNVRELEGMLLRMAVQSELLRQPIDLVLAQSILADTNDPQGPVWTIEDIQKLVCEHFRLRVSDLRSSKRARTISHPRMVAMYLCRQILGASYPEIGERFGGKDHTTVINAVRKITRLLEQDQATKAAVESLERRLA